MKNTMHTTDAKLRTSGRRCSGNRPGFVLAAAALLAVMLLCTSFPLSAQAELIDHIVAAVNNEVITASELSQVIALNERFGNSRGADRTALAAETLQGLVTRRLLVQEARRLRFVEVIDQEISAEVDKFKKQFPSDTAFSDFLQSVSMTQQELSRMLRERLLVERFVEKKVGLFVRVSRDEAQSYFDAHAAQFHGKRFQDVQKTITAVLMDQKIGQQLDQYVAELRTKAEIRVNEDSADHSPLP